MVHRVADGPTEAPPPLVAVVVVVVRALSPKIQLQLSVEVVVEDVGVADGVGGCQGLQGLPPPSVQEGSGGFRWRGSSDGLVSSGMLRAARIVAGQIVRHIVVSVRLYAPWHTVVFLSLFFLSCLSLYVPCTILSLYFSSLNTAIGFTTRETRNPNQGTQNNNTC